MSPIAGTTHDILLKIDGVDYGLMLLTQEKGKAWEREPAQPLPPSLSSGGASYTNFPPQIDKPWVQDHWRRGMGFPVWEDDNAGSHQGFAHSSGIYTRKEGYLHLGPEKTEVTLHGGGPIGTPARFHARFLNTDYFSVGNQLYKLHSEDGAHAILVNTFPNTISHLFVFKTWLLVAQGKDAVHYYSTDGNAFILSVSTNAEGELFGSRLGTLWKANGHELRTVTVADAAAWSAVTEVGDVSSDIKAIYAQDNFLRIKKGDGLYGINSTGTVSHIYNEYPYGEAVQPGLAHNQTVYFPEANNIVAYNVNGLLSDAGGGRFGRFSAPVIGRIWQMCEDQFFMYAAFEGVDGNYRVLIHELLPDGTDAWDTLVDLGIHACKMVFVSDLHTVNRRLYFGDGNSVSYVVLSRFHGDMLADENCRYVNYGTLDGPVYDLGFAAAQKALDRWSCTRELLTADHKVSLFYQIDGNGTWLPAGTQEGTAQRDFLLGREDVGVRIQPRWELWTADPTTTPVIRDTVLHARVRVTTSQHHVIRCTVEAVTDGETRGVRGREAVREIIARLLELQYRAEPIYLQDMLGEWWRVSVLRAREVATTVQADELGFAVALEILTYDQHAPGIIYNTGKKYNDGHLYARKV